LFGLNDGGAMVEARILRIIDHLPDGISEVYCHPATSSLRPVHGLHDASYERLVKDTID
jgi:hypothetical protein